MNREGGGGLSLSPQEIYFGGTLSPTPINKISAEKTYKNASQFFKNLLPCLVQIIEGKITVRFCLTPWLPTPGCTVKSYGLVRLRFYFFSLISVWMVLKVV